MPTLSSRTVPVVICLLFAAFECRATAADFPAEPSNDTATSDEAKPDQPGERKPAARKRRPPAHTDDNTKIEVSGHKVSDLEERRRSTAAKLVFGRAELDRYGDSTVGEMLKRLPGVTVAGTPGRGGDIRMRGLGSGYTQILVNGESVPKGFSIDSLAPEQIERIEVIRAPVAEYSAQAVAGTINIVLREELPKTETQLRASVGEEQGHTAPNLSVLHSDRIGSLTWMLSLSVFENSQSNQSQTQTLAYAPDGTPIEVQNVADANRTHGSGMHMAPRLTYHFDNGDTLSFQPFVTESHHDAIGTDNLAESVGHPPYTSATYETGSASSIVRGYGNWIHKYDNGGKLTIKLSGGASHSDSNSDREQYDADTLTTHDIVNDSHIHDHVGSTGGKYTDPLGNGHAIAVGWDGEWSRRDQDRVFTQDGVSQFGDTGGDFSANTRRLDVFGQDEWDINPQWAAYAGLRWEGITTRSETLAGEINNNSSVVSPMLHAVYRLPDNDKDQMRFSLTRSYRAPSLANLIAVPNPSIINTPTSPDTVGNPNLRPELAWGVDVAYEHYLEKDGILSANLFGRSIDNLIRSQTTLQGTRYVSEPFNIGKANTVGIELEAKAQLVEFIPNAPAIEFRSNYSRFWSRVDGIQGPNNRLDQQPRQTVNIGFDYRLKDIPLTLGGNLNWTPAFLVQSSPLEFTTQGNKRVVDLYGLWKFNSKLQLRISASNLLHQDYETGNGFVGQDVDQTATTIARTYTTWTGKLEYRF